MKSNKEPSRKGDPEVGARIRQIRLSKGLSLNQLAEVAKFAQPNLSKLETGQIGFSPESIRRIANALGVHISELFSEATPGKASWVPLKENGEVKEMFPTKYPVSSKAFAIRVADDSLNPIIQPGDIVICDPEVRRQPKRFAAAVITDSNNHEEIVVRRLKAVEVDWKDLNATTFFFERDPVYLLVADNSFYPPIRTEEKDKSRFLGMIVERISNMLYIQC